MESTQKEEGCIQQKDNREYVKEIQNDEQMRSWISFKTESKQEKERKRDGRKRYRYTPTIIILLCADCM